MKRIILGTILTLLISSGKPLQLLGTYKSNFADLGFFITKITFNKDYTFDYNYSGDMINKNLHGIHSVKHKNVYLTFDEGGGPKITIDSLKIENANYHNYVLKNEDGLQFHLKYKIENKKLYTYRVDNGQLVRTARFYDGKNWILRECFLEKETKK